MPSSSVPSPPSAPAAHLRLPTRPPSCPALSPHLPTLCRSPSPLPHLPLHPPALHLHLLLLAQLPPSPRPPAPSPFLLAVASVPAAVPAALRRPLSASGRLHGLALLSAHRGFSSALALLLAPSEPSSAALSDVTSSDLVPAAPPPSRPPSPFRHRLAARAVRRFARAHWLAHLPHSRRPQDDYIRNRLGFAPRYLQDARTPAARAALVYALDAVLLADGPDGLSVAAKNLVCYVLARSAENHTLTAHAAFLANRFAARDDQLAACTDVRFLNVLDTKHRRRKREDCPFSSSSAATTTDNSVDSPPRSPPPTRESSRKRHRSRAELADTLGPVDAPSQALDPTYHEKQRSPLFLSSLGSVSGSRPKKSFSFRRKKRDDSRFSLGADEGVLDPAEDLIEEPLAMSDILSASNPRAPPRIFRAQSGVPGLTGDEEDGEECEREREDAINRHSASTSDSSDERGEELSGEATLSPTLEVDFGSTERSFYDLGDNPEVPNVNGLNSMDDTREDDYVFMEDEDDYATYGRFEHDAEMYDEDILAVNDEADYFDDESDRNEIGESIFSQKEVAVLLLAHDVARASRRNSMRMSKNPDATPGPLLTPARAAQIQSLFEPEAIMEIVSVIAVFHLLQRWTVCYPYRPGSLEAPVRKFVQTPIAHDLCVRSVGQRSASKSSASLRMPQGRSIRLPRHAVVHL